MSRAVFALPLAVCLAACGSAAPEPNTGVRPPGASGAADPPAATAPAAAPSLLPAATASAAPLLAPPGADAPKPPPPIPAGTAVLHIGDSFALAGFAKALKPRMVALGARYEVRAETSAFTTTWSSKMAGIVSNTQPDLVIINLGANEVANVDPPAHAPAIRNIVKGIGGRPCVWVAPPLWRKDTGIIDVIRENSAPCRYFDSDTLVTKPIPRQTDKIHPTDEGGAIWADAFWAWLQEQRAPADAPADPPPDPQAKPLKPSPWRLKPAPPEEHRPRTRS